MMTRRQEIVDAVIERLKFIKQINDFQSDIGNNVYDWNPPSEDIEQFVIVKDPLMPVGNDTFDISKNVLKLKIIASVKDKKSSPRSIRGLCGEICHVLKLDKGFSKLERREITDVSIEVIKEGETVGQCLIEMDVHYSTERFTL